MLFCTDSGKKTPEGGSNVPGVFFFQTQIIVISHPICHNGTAR